MRNTQLTPTELNMFQEVFKVLQKYSNRTRQFGLQLVHSHFHIEKNEILYETHDEIQRTLNIRPINRESFSGKSTPLATAWVQNEKGEIEVCMFCCEGGGHGEGGVHTGGGK